MKKITIICLLTALLSGCSNEKEKNSEFNTPQEFRFQSYLKEGDKILPLGGTRVLGGTLDDGYKLIGAVTTGVDYNISLNTTTYTNGIKKLFWGTQTDASGKYEGEKRFWDTNVNTRHTFYAYSSNPTDIPAGCGVTSLEGLENTSGKSLPYLMFKQSDKPNEQMDLLTTNPVDNIVLRYATPTVNFYFRHALSRVIFKLIGSGGVPLLNCKADIRYRANTVRNAAKIELPMKVTFPTNSYHANTLYTLQNSFLLPPDAVSESTAFSLGEMILIPQNSLPLGFIEFFLTYQTVEGGETKNVSVMLPSTSLLNETQYVFLIKIIEEINTLTVTPILEPWNRESGMIDELN